MPYRDWFDNAEVMRQDIDHIYEVARAKEKELDELIELNFSDQQCPFCDNEGLDCDHNMFNPVGWYIQCPACDARTPVCRTLSSAIRIWDAMTKEAIKILQERLIEENANAAQHTDNIQSEES